MKKTVEIEELNALLPQTQCTLCGYSGCKPYAEAIIQDGESIDRCLPGGVIVLKKIAELVEKNPEPYLPIMKEKQKPRLLALVREDECIGCTKCIQACPVDAIIGAAKQMHTVIASECTGCELCIAPCPVDCIDLIELNQKPITKQEANHYRERYESRQERLEQDKQIVKKSAVRTASTINLGSLSDKKNFVKEALERAKSKKQNNGSSN